MLPTNAALDVAEIRASHALAYQSPSYAMGHKRRIQAEAILDSLQFLTYLDVGCGRGEMLDYASDKARVTGVELVEDLCDGERVIEGALPHLPLGDWTFDLVTCFDVMEHIPESLAEASIKELGRIAERYLVLTISNISDRRNGIELHINRRPYDEWHARITEWLPKFHVEQSDIQRHTISECWICWRK